MAKYANTKSVPLSIAVFLATDHYDYDDDPNTISATSLIKPTRQLVLSERVPKDEALIDIMAEMPNRIGTAIHTGFERAWLENHVQALRDLGYPEGVIERIIVNPAPDESLENRIPVYLEQRFSRRLGPYKITGKADFIGDGRVEDVKTTSTFVAMNNTNDAKFTLQGSIYRWIAPEIITKDTMAIQFVFTDWSRLRAMQDPKYPQQRHLERILVLKSIEETEAFIKAKIAQYKAFRNAPEKEIPLCNDEDLWRGEPVFKYYKNPQNTKRSTKNFETMHDARIRFIEDGGVGLIKEVPGQVTACKYCPAFAVCTQKDDLIATGDLVL